MTETSDTFMHRKWAIAFCLLSTAFVLFFNLGGRSIENNNYPHFAEIGREILETGDWMIMHSGGEMYIDKPPLHTMFIALSDMAFGVNAFNWLFLDFCSFSAEIDQISPRAVLDCHAYKKHCRHNHVGFHG